MEEKAVNALIPAEDYAAMKRYCEESDRSIASFVRKAVAAYLEHVGYRSAE